MTTFLTPLRHVLRSLLGRKPELNCAAGVSAADGGESPPPKTPPRPRTLAMYFKQLIDEVSQDTKIPASDVRKVGVAMLQRFSRLIEEQQNFASPLITLTAVTTPAKPATGDKPAVPARKFARMAIRQKPQAEEDKPASA
jgi:hypothetical protein